MAAIYLASMVLVAIAILAVCVQAVVDVSRKPAWAKPVEQRLTMVVTEDRRKQQLPFVGQDRRQHQASERRLSKAA